MESGEEAGGRAGEILEVIALGQCVVAPVQWIDEQPTDEQQRN